MFVSLLKNQSGVALYMTMMVMGIMFAVGFGVATILVGEIQTSRDAGRFVPAIAAADAGIERALYEMRRNGNFTSCPSESSCNIASSSSPILLANGASYYVVILNTGVSWCVDAPQFCIRSHGSFEGTNRALEASF